MRPGRLASVVRHPRFGDDWWRRGVIYQIYPRSFADSNGDGVGDLVGIIDHLDHLGPDGLGIDAIWLSPIYPSPGLDLGYDVSDHERVDPLFGSEDDFDRLVDARPRAGDPGDPRPGDEPHQRRAPLVRVVTGRPDGAARRLVPVGRSGGDRRRRHAPAAEQLGVVLRRSGLGVGAIARAVLLPHLPGRATRAELADAERSRPPSSRWSAAGSRAGSTASGSMSSTSSSRTRSCDRTPSGRAAPPGRARSTSTIETSPTWST